MVEVVDRTAPVSAVSAVSSTQWLALDAAGRAVAEEIVGATVQAQRHRQLFWWVTLLVQLVVAVVFISTDHDVEGFLLAVWCGAIMFTANLGVHMAWGLVNRLRLSVSARRESFDVSGLVEAVELVRLKKLTVANAVRTVDAQRPVRAR